MLNSVNIMGRMMRDPELRHVGDANVPVCNFTIAVDRDFADGGEREADFIDCVAWRKNAEFICKYFHKGSYITISGRLRVRTWTDKDENNRRNVEVEAKGVYFADSKRGDRDDHEDTAE